MFSWHDRHLRIRTRHLPPIALHWSALLGALFFGRASVGGVIGFIALVLVHEIGHAVLVRARGLRAIEIVVHAFGGGCHYEPGWGVPFDHAIIAWGGVLAQACLFAVSLFVGRVLRPGPGIFGDVLFVFTCPTR